MQETITYIKRENTDREGNTLVGKNGRPYVRVVLKVESKGDRFISGFANVDNADWEVGDEVELTITESDKKDKNGLPYLNFTTKKADKTDEKLETILNRLVGIALSLEVIKGKLEGKKSTYPQES